MKWGQLSVPWQVAIEQAWIAYCAGSLPIGAVIAAPDGRVIAEGRNRIYDAEMDGHLQHLRQHFMAHAEQNAFISLGIVRREQPDIKRSLTDCVLYSTLEPCDMCVGTLIQSGLKGVQYLVPDPVGGAIDSLTATSHVRSKNINIQGPQPGIPANIVMGIFMVFVSQTGMTMPDEIVSTMMPYADGLALAKSLVQSGELEQFRIKQLPIASIYDLLVERLYLLTDKA